MRYPPAPPPPPQRELYETRLEQERMGRIGMSSIRDQVRSIDHRALRAMPQAERVVLEDALKQAHETAEARERAAEERASQA